MNDFLEYQELYHHGILGQKWGVRRYQNADGSYTPAGRKRYAMDLDPTNTNRRNVAKIRTGEAKRRYDVAKANNPENYTRLAELKGRVRSAKKNEREVKRYDKGAELAAKGQTITGNSIRVSLAAAGSRAVKRMIAGSNLTGKTIGNLTLNDTGANVLKIYGMKAVDAAFIGYTAKKTIDNTNLRAYNKSQWGGQNTIKKVGSQEYKDVVERSKKKG